MKWRNGLALAAMTFWLITLPACTLFHPGQSEVIRSNQVPAGDSRTNSNVTSNSAKTDSPYHVTSSDAGKQNAARDNQRPFVGIKDKPREFDRTADLSSTPSTYPRSSNSGQRTTATPTSTQSELQNQINPPPYPEYQVNSERIQQAPNVRTDSLGMTSAPVPQAAQPPQPQLGSMTRQARSGPEIVYTSENKPENITSKPQPQQPPSAAPEPPLLAFIRLYLEKHPDEAVAQLRGFDKKRQDLLLGLLSAAVSISEDGTKRLEGKDAANIITALRSMALPLAPGAALILSEAHLCKTVKDYGDYAPLDKGYLFMPESHVEVYVEVGNFSKIPREGGHEVRLSNSVDFFYPDGKPVPNCHIDFEEKWIPLLSATLTRDIHRKYSFELPKSLPPGRWIMRLRVIDVPTKRSATHDFDLTVASLPSRL